jgi:hypothetical protein
MTVTSEEVLMQLRDREELMLRDIQDHNVTHGQRTVGANPVDHRCARCLALYSELYAIMAEAREIEEG